MSKKSLSALNHAYASTFCALLQHTAHIPTGPLSAYSTEDFAHDKILPKDQCQDFYYAMAITRAAFAEITWLRQDNARMYGMLSQDQKDALDL